MSFIVIIPARFAARRFPGKPLANIHGKPMVVRVMEQAQASGADRVIVATDHIGVVEAVTRAGGEACLTNSNHQSGTERLQEVINRYDFPADRVIVNVQGDEPLIPPQLINQVADNLIKVKANMATLAIPIMTVEEVLNPNAVKVVVDAYGYALYFSRATIPYLSEEFSLRMKLCYSSILRHIGIYAYRSAFIHRYVSWSVSPLEKIEMLEQLRVLWYGEKIHVAISSITAGMSVDTPEELAQVHGAAMIAD